MRVLVTPLSTGGHLLPLVPFAQALRAAGHEVRFAAPAPAEAALRDAAFPMVEVAAPEPTEQAAQRVGIDFLALSHRERDAFILKAVFMGAHLEARLTELVRVGREWSPDLVLWGDGNYVGALAAEALGLPQACIQVLVTGLLPAWYPALVDPISARLKTLRAIVGLPPSGDLRDAYSQLVLSQYPPGLLSPGESGVPIRVTVRPGRVVAAENAHAPAWLADLPGRELQPRVYMTTGTVMRADDALPIMRAAFTALADEPLQVIVTTGRIDPAELGTVPSNVHVERYVPQELLLPHCDVVIFHGGSGTLLGAIDQGLPTLITPVRADQPQNAQALAAAGAALVIPPAEVTPERVRAAVHALLDEPKYRGNARRLKAELASLPPIEHSVGLLERMGSENRTGQRAPLPMARS